jgi:hypothetical protein
MCAWFNVVRLQTARSSCITPAFREVVAREYSHVATLTHRALLDRTLLSPREEVPMLDLIFVLVTLAFFAVAWAYVRGCDRL